MARPLDAALNYTSCRTLLWILGIVTAIAALKTGLEAGHGGIWGWWLLLALLFGALWIYTWFYCGRETVTGENDLAKPARTGPPAAATATKAARSDDAASTAKSAHWARPAVKVGASTGTDAETGDSGAKQRVAASGGGTTSQAGKDRTTADTQPETSSSAGSATISTLSSTGGAGASLDASGSQASTERKPDAGDRGDKMPAHGKSEDRTSPADKATDTTSGASDDSGKKTSVAASTDASPGSKPDVLAAARDGKADDLKQISGVGPKLEGLLHSLGFFHFDQIAAWTSANVAWVDDHLGFKGRIDRDDWINQAKTLAAGETTEFAERVARGEVDSSKKS